MANLMDYLEWRGDVPFSTDPFNEVDNLILAELAYVDFAGAVPGPGLERRVSLAEANERFWSQHTEEEVRDGQTLYHLAPMILKRLADSPRFAGTELSGYVDVISEEEDSQMAAVTFFLPDGTIYAAFRGTDDTLTGWKEDFNLSFLPQTPGQRQAAEYLTACFAGGEGTFLAHDLRVGGHSKGGNFAVYAAAYCDPAVGARIREVYTNDGPGFLTEVTAGEEYQKILPRVISIIPEESVIGILLDSGYSHRVVTSDQRGLNQHDGLSWQVRRNRFETAPATSSGSAFVEKTVSRWIGDISLEDRKKFVDVIFDLVVSTGEDTLSGLQRDRLKSLMELGKSYRNMSEEDRKQIRTTMQELIRAVGEVWREQ